MTNISFKRKKVDPVDIIDGLKSLSLKYAIVCNWLENKWMPSEKYLDWAKRGVAENNEYGFENAINYAKKSVCRRIDSLILYNHLNKFFKKTYPLKMDALEKIGLKSFKIVQEFVIDPRNDLEHLYQKPSNEKADKSIQIAELYIDATQPELEKGSIIIANSCFRYGNYSPLHEICVNFCGFTDDPMLVIDIHKKEKEIEIVYPKDQEIIFAKIESFDNDQHIEISVKLREHYNESKRVTKKMAYEEYKFLLSKLTN